jgi:hypothetical protein
MIKGDYGITYSYTQSKRQILRKPETQSIWSKVIKLDHQDCIAAEMSRFYIVSFLQELSYARKEAFLI